MGVVSFLGRPETPVTPKAHVVQSSPSGRVGLPTSVTLTDTVRVKSGLTE